MAGPCLCKRGKCKTCKTKCPRCQCTRDGLSIALKVSNVRGKHLPKSSSPLSVRPKRAAATDADEAIKRITTIEVDEPLEKGAGSGYRSLREMFLWFGFTDGAYKALPSSTARKDASLATSDPEGFRRMARAISQFS